MNPTHILRAQLPGGAFTNVHAGNEWTCHVVQKAFESYGTTTYVVHHPSGNKCDELDPPLDLATVGGLMRKLAKLPSDVVVRCIAAAFGEGSNTVHPLDHFLVDLDHASQPCSVELGSSEHLY